MKKNMKKNKKNLPEVIEPKQIELAQNAGPMAQITEFVRVGGDFKDIERAMDLQDRHDAKEAKKAFIAAMAEFKKDPINIVKDMDNTQYKSKYSSIGAIVNTCLPRMGEYGLSHKWEFEPQTDVKFLTGRCVVTHKEGHSESTPMTAPIDTSGSKNAIQQIKSTRTYIKIETFASLMGIASSEDSDDDGNVSGAKLIDEKQVSQLTDMINSIENFSIDAFLSWAKIESLEDMPVFDFGKNMNALKAKAEAKK